MERKEIVAKFLKRGHQIDASALKYFTTNPEEIDEFIDSIQSAPGEQASIITLDLIKSVLEKEKPKPTVRIIKEFFVGEKKEKISIADYSKKLVDNYEAKKQMLISRVDPTKILSINKIQKQKDFVLICAIREKDPIEKSAVVEDLTGNVVVYFENRDEFEDLLENDVAAILCEALPGGIKVKQIIWPDIPLKRSVNKTQERIYCVFISDFHMDSEQFKKEQYERLAKWVGGINEKTDYKKIYVFILGGISKKKEDVEKLFDMFPKQALKIFLRSKNDATVSKREDVITADAATMLEIEGIKFLLCQGDELYKYAALWKGDAKDIMINLLKRRDLTPFREAQSMVTTLEDTLMDQVPDIFASGSFHSPTTTNYKGVSIIATGSLAGAGDPVFWATDLKTREINKLDFS